MQLISLFAPLLLALLHLLSGPPTHAPRYQAGDTLAPYVGTWIGHTPKGEFKLVLEEYKQFHIDEYMKRDLIMGRYSYVTLDGSANESLSLPADRFSLSCFADEKNFGEVYGSFEDGVNRRSFYIKMSFTNAEKTQLAWRITGKQEAISLSSDKPTLPGVYVPASVVLTKVK